MSAMFNFDLLASFNGIDKFLSYVEDVGLKVVVWTSDPQEFLVGNKLDLGKALCVKHVPVLISEKGVITCPLSVTSFKIRGSFSFQHMTYVVPPDLLFSTTLLSGATSVTNGDIYVTHPPAIADLTGLLEYDRVLRRSEKFVPAASPRPLKSRLLRTYRELKFGEPNG